MHARTLYVSCGLLLVGSALVACGGGKKKHDNTIDTDRPDGSVVDNDSGMFGSLCFPSPFKCEGTRAVPCDPGAADKAVDCATKNQVCSPSLGCVECVPGATSCADGKATWCRDNGTLARFECDAKQGLTCESGGCIGECALSEVRDSYIGCDYYPTITLNPVWSGFSFAVAVSNTADAPTEVTITRGGTEVTKATVNAKELRTFELPWVAELKGGDVQCTTPPLPGATRVVKDGAYRLRSNRPVTVYQFSPLHYKLDPIPTACPVIDPSQGRCAPPGMPPANGKCLSYSNDASLLLPANAMTGRYTALSWPTQSEQGRITGSGFVAVTATEDGTVVQVRSTGNIEPGAALTSTGAGSVALNRGDVLELIAASDSDVTGTRISADKPVQVISGQSCAYVPSGSVANCDHIEEGLFPEDALGASYVVTMPVVPTATEDQTPAPFVMRVVGIMDDSQITFEPAVHAPITLKAGQHVDVALEQANSANVLVKGSRPFQIATYMVGQSALPGGGIIGDPSMSIAVPIEQFRKSYLFTASTTYDLNYASVIAKRGARITIDGELIPASELKAVGASEYGVAQIMLSADKSVHTLESDQEVGLTVYGYGWYTSYMYPGGADLERITQPAIF